MKKAYTKSFIVIVALFVVSAVGFGTAFGYGSNHHRKHGHTIRTTHHQTGHNQ